MTTQIAQATEADITPHNIVMAAGIQIRKTPNGDVAFINTDYVSQKIINLMVEMLSSDNYIHAGEGKTYGHGMFSVVFRIDGGPYYPNAKNELRPVPWLFVEGSKTAVCNLKRCVELALEQGISGDKGFENLYMMSMKHLVWQHILIGFAHEGHHASSFMDNYMEIVNDKKKRAKEEADADEYARQAVYELAKHINLEMDMGPTIDAMYAEAWGILWEELTTTPNKDLSEHEKKFIEAQNVMKDSDIVWFGKAPDEAHEDHVLRTYKELLHHFSGDPANDPEWAIPVREPHVETVMLPNSETTNSQDSGGINEAYDRYRHEDQFEPALPPGFQGAVNQQNQQQANSGGWQQQQQQQTWGYEPEVNNGQNQQRQTTGDGCYQRHTDHCPNDAYQMDNKPVPPAGAMGQPNNQAAPYQHNLPSGTNIGQNQNAVVGANAYPASTLSTEEFQGVVFGLYNKIFGQVFGACGYNPMNGPNAPFFHQGAKIVEPINLSPAEQLIVHGMECYDGQGKLRMDAKVTGWISGRFIDKEMKMPGYSLTLSDRNGRQIHRKFIPQNPWKTNNSGQFSQTALLAQQGTCIMWIIDPDSTDKQFATRIVNGVLESNRNGSWQRVC